MLMSACLVSSSLVLTVLELLCCADWLLTVAVAVILFWKRSEVDDAPSADGSAPPGSFPTINPAFNTPYPGAEQAYPAAPVVYTATAPTVAYPDQSQSYPAPSDSGHYAPRTGEI